MDDEYLEQIINRQILIIGNIISHKKNIKKLYIDNHNIDLSKYIKTYPFDKWIIDDNGIIYNPNNSNTIIGFKKENGEINFI